MSLKNIYIKTSKFSMLLPIFMGLKYYKRLDRPFRLFLYFMIASLVTEIQASITRAVFHNNLPGQHVFTLLEFMTFSMLYYMHLRKGSLMRSLIVINAFVFIGIAIADATFVHGITKDNSLARGYSSAFIVLYTLIYFLQLFRKDEGRFLKDYPMFWICTGALIYFGNNTLYFTIRGLLLAKDTRTEWFGHLVHAGFNIIAYCFYAQSFRCFRNQKSAIS